MKHFSILLAVLWLGAAGGSVAAQPVSPGIPSVAPAASPHSGDPEGAVAGVPAHTLKVFNRPIVTFRTTLFGTPTERAADSSERIWRALDAGGEGKISSEQIPQGTLVRIDNYPAFIVGPGDVRAHLGETVEKTTASAIAALRDVIAETREARDARRMLTNGLWAGGAIVVYVGLLWLLSRIGRFVTGRAMQLANDKAHRLQVGGVALVRRERFLGIVRRVARAGYWLFVLLLTYEFLSFVLGLFPFTRPWAEGLNAFLISTTIGIVVAIARALPDLMVAILIFVLARAASQGTKSFSTVCRRDASTSAGSTPTPPVRPGGWPRSVSGSSPSPWPIRTFQGRTRTPSKDSRSWWG